MKANSFSIPHHSNKTTRETNAAFRKPCPYSYDQQPKSSPSNPSCRPPPLHSPIRSPPILNIITINTRSTSTRSMPHTPSIPTIKVDILEIKRVDMSREVSRQPISSPTLFARFLQHFLPKNRQTDINKQICSAASNHKDADGWH